MGKLTILIIILVLLAIILSIVTTVVCRNKFKRDRKRGPGIPKVNALPLESKRTAPPPDLSLVKTKALRVLRQLPKGVISPESSNVSEIPIRPHDFEFSSSPVYNYPRDTTHPFIHSLPPPPLVHLPSASPQLDEIYAAKEQRYKNFNQHYQDLISSAYESQKHEELVIKEETQEYQKIDIPNPVRPLVHKTPREVTHRDLSSELSTDKVTVQNPGLFVIMSYNIRVDVDKRPHNWKSRAHHVVANIKSIRPSVLCLQESSPQVKSHFQNSFPNWHILGDYRGRNSTEAVHILLDNNVWGQPTSNTFTLTEGGPVLCPQGACTAGTSFNGTKDKYPRVFTHVVATYKASGHNVNFVNTHLSLDDAIQEASASQLVDFIQTLSGPVIICGDMNSHYPPNVQGTPLSILQASGKLQDAHQLRDTPTFGSFQSIKPDIHRLDYILFKGLKCQYAGVSDYRYGREGFRPSDHEAVHATFEIV
jgi:endonuclease/exonuclease/phosphatase family metal-dependent hydrolase